MKKSHPKSVLVCGKDLWCMDGRNARTSNRGESVVVLQAEPNGDGRLIVEYVLAKDYREDGSIEELRKVGADDVSKKIQAVESDYCKLQKENEELRAFVKAFHDALVEDVKSHDCIGGECGACAASEELWTVTIPRLIDATQPYARRG